MKWEYFFIVGNASLVSASLLLMRHGGKSLDFSSGIHHILIQGRWWFVGIILGWVSGLLFSLVLTKVSVTTAASLYIPLVYTIAFWGGVFFLKEPVNGYKIAANILIFLGLCLFFKTV